MRAAGPVILAFIASLLMGIPAALAAPTCQTPTGDTARCGTANAMPVGWSLPEAQRASPPSGPTAEIQLSLLCVVGGFFALIALMPDFDGRRDRDWGAQEGDDETEPG